MHNVYREFRLPMSFGVSSFSSVGRILCKENHTLHQSTPVHKSVFIDKTHGKEIPRFDFLVRIANV